MLTRIGKELKHDSTHKFSYVKRRLRSYRVDERMARIGIKVYCRGRKLEAGFFMSPIQKARHGKDGMRIIEHYKAQPWETWTKKKKTKIGRNFM